MASTSGSSSTSAMFGNNRAAGLISGLNTEELVKAMAANTKNRLNTKRQKLQKLQWQQESYRSSISKISEFQEKFLTMNTTTSIKANSVMSKFKSEASDNRLITSASTTALDATYNISKITAAQAASISSTGSVAAGKVTLDFSNNVAGETYDVVMTLDGTKKTVTFTGGADAAASKQNFLDAVNDTFSSIKTASQSFSFEEGTTNLVFNGGSDNICHTFDVGYNSKAIGLANTTSSRISSTSTLGDISFATELTSTNADGSYKFNINGVDFKFDKNTTVANVVSAVNSSKAGVKMTFSSVSQTFELESKTTGTAGSIKITQDGSNLLNSIFNTSDDFSTERFGTNGTVTLSNDGENYVTYTSASNIYTFDGTTIDISKIGSFDSAADGVDEITVKTERDTSSIKDSVVKFVEEYNTMLSDLYKTVNTARPKSKGSFYEPLTEEQEEEMEKDEIKDWNEKAKTGLLYHDSNLTRFVSNLRTAMTTSVDGFSLSDMGITVSKNLADNGKLIIDETKLDASIKSYGEQISTFFTDPEKGLAANVNTVVDKAVSKTTNNYGYLTQLAGIENTNSEKKNTLYSQINSLQTLIKNIEDKYDKEIERYWKQFTNLETYMSKMQNQASYFSQE